jgi:hypothetical protein
MQTITPATTPPLVKWQSLVTSPIGIRPANLFSWLRRESDF